jgi:hypothetical protein
MSTVFLRCCLYSVILKDVHAWPCLMEAGEKRVQGDPVHASFKSLPARVGQDAHP